MKHVRKMRIIMQVSKLPFCILAVVVTYVSAFNYDRSDIDTVSDLHKTDSSATPITGHSPPVFLGQNNFILTNKLNNNRNDLLNDAENSIEKTEQLVEMPLDSEASVSDEKTGLDEILSDSTEHINAFLKNVKANNLVTDEQAKPVISKKCIDMNNCDFADSENMNGVDHEESYLRDIRQGHEKVEYQLTLLSDEQEEGDNFVRSKDENELKQDKQNTKHKHIKETEATQHVHHHASDKPENMKNQNIDSNNILQKPVLREVQNGTDHGLAPVEYNIVEKKSLFGGIGVGVAPSRCELDTFSIDMSFSEHVELETGNYVLTCRGSVTVNKCEGMCASHVTPSVNHRDGFVKECSCCRDSSTRSRSITLTMCALGAQDVVGYSLSRDIIEPTACSCRHCRN